MSCSKFLSCFIKSVLFTSKYKLLPNKSHCVSKSGNIEAIFSILDGGIDLDIFFTYPLLTPICLSNSAVVRFLRFMNSKSLSFILLIARYLTLFNGELLYYYCFIREILQSLHRDTTQTGIKMPVTTKSRNSYTFIGKYSDSH